MPFNGNGLYTRGYNWQNDAASGINIRADEMDGQDDDLGSALSNCICKDGQSVVTAPIPFNGNKLLNVGLGTARTDAANLANIQDNTTFWGGTAGGSANAITITLSPIISAYVVGAKYSFLASATNTGATTLNINGVAATSIVKNASTALEAGDIKSGQVVTVQYDGTNFQLNYDLEGKNINMNGKLLTLANVTLSSIKSCYEPAYNLGNISGALTIDYNNGHEQYGTLTGNISGVTFSNWPASGNRGNVTLTLTQDGTGSRTLTLSGSYKSIGGLAVVLSTAANKTDEVIFRSKDGGTTFFTNINKDYH